VVASAFQFVQRPITLTNLLPFCAVVGGMLGAIWEYARNPKAGFPSVPSFRGALLGALFAFCFVIFGLGILGTTHALSVAGGKSPTQLVTFPLWSGYIAAVIFLTLRTRHTSMNAHRARLLAKRSGEDKESNDIDSRKIDQPAGG
jgi:hypothetical protein